MNPNQRVESILNLILAAAPMEYKTLLEQKMTLTDEQRAVLITVVGDYPELNLTTHKDLPLWAVMNAVVDILIGKRLSVKVNTKTGIIHQVVWVTGNRAPVQEPPNPHSPMGNYDWEEGDGEDEDEDDWEDDE